MNKLNFIILTILLLFEACEYDPSGNNFVELTPPEDYISFEILLNDINPSDTIYIYQNTSISIKINSPKDLQQAEVLLDGQEYKNMWTDSLVFVFYPNPIDEGVHTLTIDAIFSSGTGSLADLMGLEGYTGELSWNIYVIHDLQDQFEVDYRINEEGFLELFWDNVISDNYIGSYTIDAGYTQEEDIIINDAKQKLFVDYGYVCDDAYYKLRTHLKDGNVFYKILWIDTPIPSVYFEDLGLDSFRVYWDKPFANGRFILKEENINVSEIYDTSIIIPQIFGDTRQFRLEILPQKAEYDMSYNTFTVRGSFLQGTSLGLPNWPLYAYNRTDNIIYSSKYSSLVAFDASSLEIKNTVSIEGNPWGLDYGGKLASAPHNSTVAAMTGEETWIFANSHFVNPVIISPLRGNINTKLSALTSDDRFFVVEQNSNICKVFNSLTGEKIFDLPFTYNTIYTFPDFDAVSENGQFFCASSGSGIEVFEINGITTNLLYTDTRNYRGALSVPSQPDKLLLRVDTDIELRQMPGFDLIQTIDVSTKGALLCNIDPVSMSLLYYQNDSLKVSKINDLTDAIFKMKSNDAYCKLFNNKLLSSGDGGITFDINAFLSN